MDADTLAEHVIGITEATQAWGDAVNESLDTLSADLIALRSDLAALDARVHLIALTFTDLEREHSVKVEP